MNAHHDRVRRIVKAQLKGYGRVFGTDTVFPLPPYAPQLNPVEGIWSVLTRTVLANLAATGLDHLITVIKHGLKRLQYRPGLIDGCLAETGLALTSR